MSTLNTLWWTFLCPRLDRSCHTTVLWFWGRRVGTGLTETHPRPACVQVRALAGILSVSWAHGRKYCYKEVWVCRGPRPACMQVRKYCFLSNSVARSEACLTLVAWMSSWVFILCISFLLWARHCLGWAFSSLIRLMFPFIPRPWAG